MTRPLTVGGLFSGIGGWELGLERAGMEIAWHCEADPFCQRVLEKHWPGVRVFDDVCTLTAGMAEGVDVLCGGFPCQGLSDAGLKLGLLDPRSGLWSEFARLIGEFRPRYVCVENVAALLGRGLGTVLGDLAALGYDAEWDCIPATAVGAPHRRDRIWIVAYPAKVSDSGKISHVKGRQRDESPWQLGGSHMGAGGPAEYWRGKSAVPRVVDGFPPFVDRVGALGNALVPQIAEWIGRRIVEYELELERA